MSGEWTECKLGDVLTLKRGYDLPTRKRQPGDVPIVSSSGITGFHNEAKVNGPGIVTGRYGTLGEVFYVDDDYWPLNTTLYVQDFKGNDPRFVGYFLRTLSFAAQNAAGAVPGVNRNHLHMMSVSIPPLTTQRHIVSILSTYDDLIENNRRRIEILEEMARNLYREWFVHFRFPGHEDVKFVDSSLGPIPEGWEVKRLGDTCTIVMGQSPKSEFYNEHGEGLPFHQGVSNFGERFPVHKIYCTVDNRVAEPGDILFSVRAPVGRMNIADTRLIVGRGLAAIRNNQGHQHFTYHQLVDRFYEEDMLGGGTIFKSVTKKDMHGIEFICPPDELTSRFGEVIDAIAEQIQNLAIRSDVLRRTRDLLLPRLVAGDDQVISACDRDEEVGSKL